MTSRPVVVEESGVPDLARSTLAVSSLNLLSRVTGLARVLAMSAALGATSLGDTYQAANLTSNILFELLAGGVLSAALVPTFVSLIDQGRRPAAVRLAGAVLGAVLVLLALTVAAGLLGARHLMALLTSGVADEEVRSQQIELGTFLLWFFLPQLLLYAVGAIATALLHAERRFIAAAIAPVFNNGVVIASMLVFWWMREGEPGFDLSTPERLVLASGATLGVLAMVSVPLLAAWREGMRLRPRWEPREPLLAVLVGRGAWAAGHLALSQVLLVVTLLVAGRVSGGVIAYQVAFTIFLLPHALVANPVATTLFPRLSAQAAAGRLTEMAGDLARGLRILAFFLVPAGLCIAALARPALELARLGNLDAAGAELVATATAAYMVGLVGYASFSLLVRAFYALGDTRTPTLVSLLTIGAGVAVMTAGSRLVSGAATLVLLGITHAGAVSAGSLILAGRLRARTGRLGLGLPLLRDLALGAVAAGIAWSIAQRLGIDTRLHAGLGVGLGAAAASGAYLLGQLWAGSQELSFLRAWRGER